MCSAEQVSGRDRILEEAAALFVRQGYRETTLRDIAAAAGMKAGSIYYHFDAKDELLAAVLETGIARITRSFEETAASLPDDVAPSRSGDDVLDDPPATVRPGDPAQSRRKRERVKPSARVIAARKGHARRSASRVAIARC